MSDAKTTGGEMWLSDFLRRVDILTEWIARCAFCPRRRRFMFFSPHLFWFWRDVPKILRRRDDYARFIEFADVLFRAGVLIQLMEHLKKSEWTAPAGHSAGAARDVCENDTMSW